MKKDPLVRRECSGQNVAKVARSHSLLNKVFMITTALFLLLIVVNS